MKMNAKDASNARENVKWVTIGFIAAPHGVKGMLRVVPATDFPDRFRGLNRVFLCLGEKRCEFKVQNSGRLSRGMVCLGLQGLSSRDSAEQWRGASLQVPRHEAVPLPEGHFYVFDLVGCTVDTVDGRRLGTLKDVYPTGANDVYSIIADDGKELLIPALKTVVLSIDIDARKIVVDPPPGLLD